jgi:hypothetical protein
MPSTLIKLGIVIPYHPCLRHMLVGADYTVAVSAPRSTVPLNIGLLLEPSQGCH